MELDPVFLSRVQFAFVIAFHILLPAFTVALASLIVMVALGTLFSSFWILAFNSWMQTPQGHVLTDGRFLPESWLAIIFNPSFPYRLMHTVTGFYLTTAFAVLGVTAWHLKRGQHVAES